MAKIHINPETGEPGSCRVNSSNPRSRGCPFGLSEDEHYESMKEARTFYERHQQFLADASEIEPRYSPATEQALGSELSYEGPSPRWFKRFPREALQRKIFGTQTEILDLIDGPQGKMAVLWSPQSMLSKDVSMPLERGVRIARLSYRELKDGKELGYLSVSITDDESMKLSFGRDGWEGLRYLDVRRGSHLLDRDYGDDPSRSKDSMRFTGKEPHRDAMRILSPEERTEDESERRALKAKLCEELSRDSLFGYELPGELKGREQETLTPEEVDLALEGYRKKAIELMDKDTEHFRAMPHVDYIKVKEELRGKGFGHSLYIFGAKRLAKGGYALRGSGIQTPEAQRSWIGLAADSRTNVAPRTFITRSLYGSRSIDMNPVMDMR